MRISKAKAVEQSCYRGANPLYGWLMVNEKRCPVEYLGEGRGEPNYEVLAPEGQIFMPDGTHTIIGTTLVELYERAGMVTLEAERQ